MRQALDIARCAAVRPYPAHYSAYKHLFEASMCCRSLSLLIAVKIMILLVVLGCSSNSDTEEAGTPPASAPPATGPAVAAGTTLSLRPVVTGLSGPVHITHAGDERLFIVEQPGRIRIVGSAAPQPQSGLACRALLGSSSMPCSPPCSVLALLRHAWRSVVVMLAVMYTR